MMILLSPIIRLYIKASLAVGRILGVETRVGRKMRMRKEIKDRKAILLQKELDWQHGLRDTYNRSMDTAYTTRQALRLATGREY